MRKYIEGMEMKRPRGREFEYGEKRESWNLSLTPSAIALADRMAAKRRMARSQFLEKAIRAIAEMPDEQIDQLLGEQ